MPFRHIPIAYECGKSLQAKRVSTCLDVAKRFHVFDRLFIDLGVPKGDAHVGSLRLTIGKDDRAVEEGLDHMYSGWILANKMLESTARTILRPKPSQAMELTMPD